MADTPLYLFKAARRPRYLQENLQILGGERGSIIEVSYNRSWVAPTYFGDDSIAPGTPVYFVFTERPYSLFVPVRCGEVVAIKQEEVILRLRILLKAWIGIEGWSLDDFTRLVKEINPAAVPGSKFVSPKTDGVKLFPFYDERENEGWTNAIDNVLEMSRTSEDDPYRESVFFRTAGLHTGGELVEPARHTPLEIGSTPELRLRFHNPHLSAAADRLRLSILTGESLAPVPDHAFPLQGDLSVAVSVEGPDPELTFEIIPTPARHTLLTQRLHTAGSERRSEPAPPAPGHGVRAAELLRLYEMIRRNTEFRSPGDELDYLDAMERLLPGEERIVEDRALVLRAQGQDEEAFQRLRSLNPETLRDESRFLLFRLHLERHSATSPAHLLSNLDLAAEGRFPRLLDELGTLDPRLLARVVPSIAEVLGRDQLRELIQRIGRRIEAPDALSKLTELIYPGTDDARWAYDFLAERHRTLRLADPAVEGMLLELAQASGATEDAPELLALARRQIINLIQRGDLDRAAGQLRRATRALEPRDRERLTRGIADSLVAAGQRDHARDILIEFAYAACDAGNLTGATQAAEWARALWNGNGEPPSTLRDAIDHVERAWQDCETLIEWRASEHDRRRTTLRAALLNRRVLIVGGKRRLDWEEHLGNLSGAAIDWAESFRGEEDDLAAYAERIRNGAYRIVIYNVTKAGHGAGERISPACKAAGVPLVHALSAGRRGMEEALWGAVEGRQA